MHQEITSFDVYDTCISRLYQNPTDLFLHIGRLIYKEDTHNENIESFCAKFRTKRIEAERIATKAKRGTTTLDEIYNSFYDIHSFGDKNAIKSIELKLETESIYPIDRIANKIHEIKKDGGECIFISDMYLSKDYIKNILLTLNIASENDYIFVSSDEGRSKHKGDLFLLASKTTGVPTKAIHHYGDNKYTDIKSAQKNGLKATLIPDSIIKKHEMLFASINGDYRKSVINAIPRSLRLTKLSDIKPELHQYFSVAAPCLITFTAWAMKKAKDLGATSIYFCARDMEIPYAIAKEMAAETGLRVAYLKGSRLSWTLPSGNALDDNWMNALIPGNEKASLSSLLKRLHFSNVEMDAARDFLHFSHENMEQKVNRDNALDLLKAALSVPAVKQLLEAKIRDQSENCIGYLRELGLFYDKRIFIVDSGWAMNSQYCIRQIIQKFDSATEICGLYFGLSPNALSPKLCGQYYSFNENSHFYYYRGDALEKILFPTSEISVTHYSKINKTFAPENSSTPPPMAEVEFSRLFKDYALQYFAASQKMGLDYRFFEQQKETFKGAYLSFLKTPPRKIVTELKKLSVNTGAIHNEENQIDLIHAIDLKEALSITIGFFIPQNKRRYTWPEGSAAISGIFVKLILHAGIHIKEMLKNTTEVRREVK